MSAQSMQALGVANAKRGQIERLRRDIRDGRVDWRDVITDPPECVEHMLVSEFLMRMVYGMDRRTVERVGFMAWRQGVTLTVRVGRCPRRTREWLVGAMVPWGDAARARSRRGLLEGPGRVRRGRRVA